MSADDKIVHLDDRRAKPTMETDMEEWRTLAKLFHERNAELLSKVEGLTTQNVEQSGKIDRLVRGVEMLVGEMHAFRSGKSDGAFARLARADEEPDLLRTEADVALHYPHSAGEIGRQLGGFTASQIGTLLGKSGLKWGGNPNHEEMTRWKEGRTRFWHRDVPVKLADILTNGDPDDLGIQSKAARSMFATYRDRARTK